MCYKQVTKTSFKQQNLFLPYCDQLHWQRDKQQSFCCLQLRLPGEKKKEGEREREAVGANAYVTLPELCDMFYHCNRQKQQGANPREPLQTRLIKFCFSWSRLSAN